MTHSIIARRRGFTIAEVLLVLAIIGILVAIVFVAVNPGKQMGDSRNAKRRSDLSSMMNSLYQYYLDKGNFPKGIPTNPASPKEICRDAKFSAHRCDPSKQVVLDVLSGAYLLTIPEDPDRGNPVFHSVNAGSGTYYFIGIDKDGRISLSAPGAELIDGSGERTTITVTR